MILNPEDKLQNSGSPCRNMHFLPITAFLTEKCTFMQKTALSCRAGKLFLAEECNFQRKHGRNCRCTRASRLKNRKRWPTFTIKNSQRFAGLSPSALSCQRIQEVQTFRRKWSGVREAEMLGKKKRPTCAYCVLKSMFGAHRRSCVVLRGLHGAVCIQLKNIDRILLQLWEHPNAHIVPNGGYHERSTCYTKNM